MSLDESSSLIDDSIESFEGGNNSADSDKGISEELFDNSNTKNSSIEIEISEHLED